MVDLKECQTLLFSKSCRKNISFKNNMKNVLIVGAGVAGRDIQREINRNKKLGINVIGFIDDDEKKQKKRIDSSWVIGTRKDIKQLVALHRVDEIIIAIPSAHGEVISELVKSAVEAKVGFRIVPRVKEIIEGEAHIATLRPVSVEDLLGRPIIKSDVAGLKSFFKNKNVLVTGAAGSIGSELSRQIAAYKPHELILLDWWETGLFSLQQELIRVFPTQKLSFVIANIRDEQKINAVFDEYLPHLVFHAAAYKHVPLMEDHPDEAVKNNIFGTLNLAKTAVKAGAKDL